MNFNPNLTSSILWGPHRFYLAAGSGVSYKDDVYSECDYYTELSPDNEYFIVNPNYPSFYTEPTRCRWVNMSPPNTSIVLKCLVIDLSQVRAAFCIVFVGALPTPSERGHGTAKKR